MKRLYLFIAAFIYVGLCGDVKASVSDADYFNQEISAIQTLGEVYKADPFASISAKALLNLYDLIIRRNTQELADKTNSTILTSGEHPTYTQNQLKDAYLQKLIIASRKINDATLLESNIQKTTTALSNFRAKSQCLPSIFREIEKKYNGNVVQYVTALYGHTKLTDSIKLKHVDNYYWLENHSDMGVDYILSLQQYEDVLLAILSAKPYLMGLNSNFDVQSTIDKSYVILTKIRFGLTYPNTASWGSNTMYDRVAFHLHQSDVVCSLFSKMIDSLLGEEKVSEIQLLDWIKGKKDDTNKELYRIIQSEYGGDASKYVKYVLSHTILGNAKALAAMKMNIGSQTEYWKNRIDTDPFVRLIESSYRDIE